MADDDVQREWLAALHFLAKGPSATLEFLKHDPRTRLFAYKVSKLSKGNQNIISLQTTSEHYST